MFTKGDSRQKNLKEDYRCKTNERQQNFYKMIMTTEYLGTMVQTSGSQTLTHKIDEELAETQIAGPHSQNNWNGT